MNDAGLLEFLVLLQFELLSVYLGHYFSKLENILVSLLERVYILSQRLFNLLYQGYKLGECILGDATMIFKVLS